MLGAFRRRPKQVALTLDVRMTRMHVHASCCATMQAVAKGALMPIKVELSRELLLCWTCPQARCRTAATFLRLGASVETSVQLRTGESDSPPSRHFSTRIAGARRTAVKLATAPAILVTAQ